MFPGKFHVLGVVVLAVSLSGCGKSATPAAKTGKTVAVPKPQPAPPKIEFAKLLPEETFLYVRINDVQRAKEEFINPKHVKDAKTARPAWHSMLNDFLKAVRGSDDVPVLTILRLATEIKNVHVGAFPPTDAGRTLPEFAAYVEVSDSTGLDALQKHLAKKLKTVAVAETKVHFIEGLHEAAFYRPTPNSVVLGTQSSLRALLERAAKPDRRSLADSPRFQQALDDFGSTGELFTFADVERLRPTGMKFPVAGVSHFGVSMGVDGGFALRAYAADGQTLPENIVRSSRKKTLLSSLPKETAVLLSASFDADHERRKQFADWITLLVKTDDILQASAIPQGVRKLAKSFFARTDNVENDAAGILKDLWLGLGPVKSETAIFVAPNSQGQWGVAALFDTNDAADVVAFKEKLQALGLRAKLQWQQVTYEGMTIHTLDVSTRVAGENAQSLPENVEQLLQLQLGYAESNGQFAVGSVDLIKFALKPKGSTLAGAFSYGQIDEANAMMFSIRPGQILNRTFGFEPIDTVLRKVATQIPIDSNYTFTLTLEPHHATLRSNIPFTSLVGWLVLEWKGEGPAHLKDRPPASKTPPRKERTKKTASGN